MTDKADDSIRLGLLDVEAEIAADAMSRTPEQFRRQLKERARNLANDDGVERSEQQRQGPTDLKFLFPVCAHHHHRLHERRWQAQLDASTRQLAVTYPDETLHSQSRPDLLADTRVDVNAAATA